MALKKKVISSTEQQGRSNTLINVGTDPPQDKTVKEIKYRENSITLQSTYYKRMTGEQTIKVIVFSGKKKDFTDYWEDKFLALASSRGFQ